MDNNFCEIRFIGGKSLAHENMVERNRVHLFTLPKDVPRTRIQF
jgi:hypothetical protein